MSFLYSKALFKQRYKYILIMLIVFLFTRLLNILHTTKKTIIFFDKYYIKYFNFAPSSNFVKLIIKHYYRGRDLNKKK